MCNQRERERGSAQHRPDDEHEHDNIDGSEAYPLLLGLVSPASHQTRPRGRSDVRFAPEHRQWIVVVTGRGAGLVVVVRLLRLRRGRRGRKQRNGDVDRRGRGVGLLLADFEDHFRIVRVVGVHFFFLLLLARIEIALRNDIALVVVTRRLVDADRREFFVRRTTDQRWSNDGHGFLSCFF